ncbi:H15 domain-containing protein [Haematococcus lacustris]|uniref:H15 domain-containing protein n=1 Tax=Haematococcus lacustris TaxID=44745 RepID=A0A699YRN8_HAELA|nr:H15 domain-containing protein [Haematococcus lacustris]
MIVESITALKERTGSSQPAIKKWIEAKYAKDLPSTWEKILSVQLKRMAQAGVLVKASSAKPKAPKTTQPAKPAGVKKVKTATPKVTKAAAPSKAAASKTKKPAAAKAKKPAAPKAPKA